MGAGAPPGAGKTTLMASYLDARAPAALWYQIDEGDGDLASFFYYMDLASRRATRSRRKPLAFLTPEYLQGLAAFTRNYFRDCFARLERPRRCTDP